MRISSRASEAESPLTDAWCTKWVYLSSAMRYMTKYPPCRSRKPYCMFVWMYAGTRSTHTFAGRCLRRIARRRPLFRVSSTFVIAVHLRYLAHFLHKPWSTIQSGLHGWISTLGQGFCSPLYCRITLYNNGCNTFITGCRLLYIIYYIIQAT